MTMAASSLLAVGFIMKFMAIIFVVIALGLILVILVQKAKGGGLSGAFGGGGGAGGVLGAKTGDFLTWFTIGLAVLFLVLLVLMAKFYKPTVGGVEAPSAPAQQSAPGGEI
jgi:preprotein translocase subunit SecG